MEKVTIMRGNACPIDQANMNTDQILPARYLKWSRAQGLDKVLFHDLRFDSEGNERSHFPLNTPQWRNAQIIVGARNFGCGSSREAAVYALYDYGIRCIIAPSFGDIFSGNAAQNGLLLATVTEVVAAEITDALNCAPELSVTVDLERQEIVCGNRTYTFTIEPIHRTRLLNGWDDIALTASYRDQISAFRASDRKLRPWALPYGQ
jgi:3-isopropylmalate/(R)-2-methylmalate dehydratase small subunit